MHIDIKKVCVATDFSEEGKHAETYGAALAKQFGGELHILHVLNDFDATVLHPDYPSTNETAEDYYKRMEQGAQELLNKVAEPKPDFKVERVVRFGAAYHEICRYARDAKIDLLVVGTHGRTGLKHLLLGSVAERVVRGSPCPVLTVRSEEHEFVVPD